MLTSPHAVSLTVCVCVSGAAGGGGEGYCGKSPELFQRVPPSFIDK